MFVSVPRATKAHKARLLNAAYRLRGQPIDTAEAARQLADQLALSLRHAYRDLEQAAALKAPPPAIEPSVAITFKLPVSIVRALRSYSRRSGLTLGEIVTRAVAGMLGALPRRRG